MNGKRWRMIGVTAVYVAALLAGGHGAIASAEEGLDEAGLIGVLESDAGWSEKQAACRSLRRIATVKAVPVLAALLPDERLSHMARYALEPMACPEAGQALRDALAKTEGMPKVGVIVSIGARQDAGAGRLLVPLLQDANADVARAAAGALGRIATSEAVKALLKSDRAAPETVQPAVLEGLLAAGQHLARNGEGDRAARIYEKLLAPGRPMHVRMGAFHGLALAQPDQAPERLIAALRGDEPLFRDMAAQIVAETSGAEVTKQYAEALPKLPSGGQEALLRGLEGRKDPAARAAIVQAVDSPDLPVKLAAVKALAAVGGARDVGTLAALLASSDTAIVETARAALTVLQGDGVNAAMAAAVPEAAPAARAELLGLLAQRQAAQAMPLALEGLDDADVAVRIAGLRVVALLGGKEQATVVVAAVVKAADSAELAAAEKALATVCSDDSAINVLPIVLDAMDGADPASRKVLLRALGRIGGPEALKTVLAALDDSDAEISDEAVRVLSDWSSLDAVPHLYKLARSDDLGRQVLALRGYVRLARLEPSAKEKTSMLTKAMRLAERPDEKKLVVAAWGTLPTKQSLKTLQPYLDDAAVQNEAATAIVAVAGELGKESEKDKPLAVDALKAVIAKCENADIRKSARKALKEIE